MTIRKTKPKLSYDTKVAATVFAVIVVTVLLMYAFGSPPPIGE